VAGAVLSASVVAASVLGLAAPASAHNYLVASTPAVNGTLTSLPKTFEITTNDRLLDIGGTDSGFAMRIVGPDGKYYEDGCVDIEGPSMTTAAALGVSGKYTVEWQIISADGHTVSDQYGFTWRAPSGATPSKGSTKPPTCATDGTGSSAAAASSPDDASAKPASAASDALFIGAGGLVVVAALVAVLLLVRRRPAPAADVDDPDES
jgi:hypothetical protein